MRIVVDTGPLVALADADDQHHSVCRAWFVTVDPVRLVLPAPVIAEACHLITRKCGTPVEAQFLRDLAEGDYGQLVLPTPPDLHRAADLVERYTDLPLGGTDALVIAVAERLGVEEVATLDHRHFTIVKTTHGPLTLLPALRR